MVIMRICLWGFELFFWIYVVFKRIVFYFFYMILVGSLGKDFKVFCIFIFVYMGEGLWLSLVNYYFIDIGISREWVLDLIRVFLWNGMYGNFIFFVKII